MSRFQSNGMSLRINRDVLDALNLRRQFHEFSFPEIVGVDTGVNTLRLSLMIGSLVLLAALLAGYYLFSGLHMADASLPEFTLGDSSLFTVVIWSFILICIFFSGAMQPDRLLVLETRGGKIWRAQVSGVLEHKIQEIERAKGVINKVFNHHFDN